MNKLIYRGSSQSGHLSCEPQFPHLQPASAAQASGSHDSVHRDSVSPNRSSPLRQIWTFQDNPHPGVEAVNYPVKLQENFALPHPLSSLPDPESNCAKAGGLIHLAEDVGKGSEELVMAPGRSGFGICSIPGWKTTRR